MNVVALRARPAGSRAESVTRDGGIGRSSSPTAVAVSNALRRGAGEMLEHRRRTARLALGSIAAFVPVAAYQMGLLKHLPDLPSRQFDSDKVDASGEAYKMLSTPDAALAMVSYGITLALAGTGGADRAEARPWLPLALAGKVALDAVGAVYLTAEQLSKHRHLCTFCTTASLLTLAMVPHVIPEARQSWRCWRNG